MNELTQKEMEQEVEGGGWLADRVAEFCCWVECHQQEIGEAYVRMYESGLAGMS